MAGVEGECVFVLGSDVYRAAALAWAICCRKTADEEALVVGLFCPSIPGFPEDTSDGMVLLTGLGGLILDTSGFLAAPMLLVGLELEADLDIILKGLAFSFGAGCILFVGLAGLGVELLDAIADVDPFCAIEPPVFLRTGFEVALLLGCLIGEAGLAGLPPRTDP